MLVSGRVITSSTTECWTCTESVGTTWRWADPLFEAVRNKTPWLPPDPTEPHLGVGGNWYLEKGHSGNDTAKQWSIKISLKTEMEFAILLFSKELRLMAKKAKGKSLEFWSCALVVLNMVFGKKGSKLSFQFLDFCWPKGILQKIIALNPSNGNQAAKSPQYARRS